MVSIYFKRDFRYQKFCGPAKHRHMAAMESLLEYGSSNSSDSSDSDNEKAAVTEESTLHLKPVNKEKESLLISKDMSIVAAPEVATKVTESKQLYLYA